MVGGGNVSGDDDSSPFRISSDFYKRSIRSSDRAGRMLLNLVLLVVVVVEAIAGGGVVVSAGGALGSVLGLGLGLLVGTAGGNGGVLNAANVGLLADDEFVELVAVLVDLDLDVVREGECDVVGEAGLVAGVVELGDVGVLEGRLHIQSAVRVEHEQRLAKGGRLRDKQGTG